MRNEEVVLFIVSVTPGGLYCFDAFELERASLCFVPVLETVFSVLNLINYLHFRVPQVGLGTLFEVFGPSLQVTCRHGGRVETGVFLNQTHQINGHFWDIKKDIIEQKDIL